MSRLSKDAVYGILLLLVCALSSFSSQGPSPAAQEASAQVWAAPTDATPLPQGGQVVLTDPIATQSGLAYGPTSIGFLRTTAPASAVPGET